MASGSLSSHGRTVLLPFPQQGIPCLEKRMRIICRSKNADIDSQLQFQTVIRFNFGIL
uniref:Uncharacterized protein n=1 Tax=Lobelia galpinii TaxID=2041126 RepID=A0A291EXQ9_9ASTR|nr:hypothetical protein Lo_gal1Pt0018 [Lobelia galpinii]ATG24665.1 hypothetical protein Lo_gal1Pt0018 [Lobelia galpinii]